jgi:hypothetical protein
MTFYTKTGFGPDCSLGYLARRIHQIGQSLIEPGASLHYSARVSTKSSDRFAGDATDFEA